MLIKLNKVLDHIHEVVGETSKPPERRVVESVLLHHLVSFRALPFMTTAIIADYKLLFAAGKCQQSIADGKMCGARINRFWDDAKSKITVICDKNHPIA